MNHSTYVNHSSSIWNCNTNFLSWGGRGGKGTRKGGQRGEKEKKEKKEKKENGVVFNLNSLSFQLC